MLRIYSRVGKIGEAAYEEVGDFLKTQRHPFTEIQLTGENPGNPVFGERYIELFSENDYSLILDGHKGPNYTGKVYIHAPAGRRIPSGLVRRAFETNDVVLEVDHGPSVGDAQNWLQQAYLEVAKKDDAGKVVDVVRQSVSPAEIPGESSIYTAVKNGKWVVERKTVANPEKETYIIVPEKVKFGVPIFLEEGSAAIKDAISTYNLDIRSVCHLSSLQSPKKAEAYIFQSPSEARNVKHLLAPKGVRHILALTKSKSLVYPYFLFGDAENNIINGALNSQNNVGNKYDAKTIHDVRNAIMMNVVCGDNKGGQELSRIFMQENLFDYFAGENCDA